MKILKKLFIFLTISILIFLLILYFIFLLVIPDLLNKEYTRKKIENIVNKKTGMSFILEGFEVKSDKKLLYTFKADKIQLNNKENRDLLTADDVSFDYFVPLRCMRELNIKYIFINETGFKNLIKENKKKKTSSYRIKNLPSVNIEKAEIWVDRGNENKVFLNISDIKLLNEKDKKTYINFDAEIVSPLLKNTLNIGREGNFYITNKALYADNVQILMGIHSLNVNGKLIDDDKKNDFTLKGDELPVSDIENSLLYFQKIKKPGKQFLENFKEFSGDMDVNLTFKDGLIFGNCIARNLGAKTVLYNVPVLFKKADFKFNGRDIVAREEGLLGNEKVETFFKMDNLLTDEQTVTGEVKSVLSDKFADKYIPNLTIKKTVEASLKYHIKNRKIGVEYLAKLDKGADLYFRSAYLGLEGFRRKLQVKTLKDGDKLSVEEYSYSSDIEYDKEYKKLMFGNGLFEKIDGHFRLKYLTFKTDGYAPFSATGSISRYLYGGYFNGNLKYDYIDNKITGKFKLKDAKYKSFYVDEAEVDAKDKNLIISAYGKYNNSDFKCVIDAINSFDKEITINNLDLFLDKYIVQKMKASNEISKISSTDILEAAKEIDVTVKKWNIRLNEIRHKKIIVKDIALSGSLKNNIFKFIMTQAKFADGLIKADGYYNFSNNSSMIDFSANNIDSNIVADSIFNLPGQIHGIAGAKIHAQTKNKLDEIKAHAQFSIKDGYLLKLGSTEFIIKKSKKIKKPIKIRLQDIINVDISKTKALSSDIEGNFDINNYKLENVCITSKQKYMSMLIEGEYNIEDEYADLNLWGKYNKNAQKGVRILFIPLSWIVNIIFRPEQTKHLYLDKLDKIPEIQAREEEEKYFRVKLNGDLNKNNVNVELRTIK